MSQSYKSLKEDFVSNLSGGDIFEINLVTAVAPAAVLLWSVLQSRHVVFVPYGVAAFAIDFLLNVGAILLAITLYSRAPAVLNILLLLPAFLLYILTPLATGARRSSKPPRLPNGPPTEDSRNDELLPFPVRPFVTTYRGAMMVVTCIAILAVDFKVFPRRFAKVENWGTSLMDMGVGSFVFSAGVVAAKPILKDRMAGKPPKLGRRLWISARHSLPLLLLGLIRLYSVKGLDYAEHITEYGVHWNFFFTLALLPPFVAVFQSLFSLVPSYELLSLLLGSVYQGLLELTRLKAYILTAPRKDLLSKNREGVFSFLGYLAIFLAGQAAGQYLLPRRPIGSSPSKTAKAQRFRILARLAAWSVIWSSLLFLTTAYKYGLGFRVSRRLANLPYVLWVAAFNCTQIAMFCTIETLIFPTVYKATHRTAEAREGQKATSRILQAYNRNGLAIFLLANLLTGLVNLTVDTLSVRKEAATAILFGYIVTLTGVALALDSWNISIKV
ncbi:MAG: hypothetical protein Q9187_001431 [Circinaria calcarea]